LYHQSIGLRDSGVIPMALNDTEFACPEHDPLKAEKLIKEKDKTKKDKKDKRSKDEKGDG